MSRIPSPLRPALVTLVIAAAAAAIAAGDPPAGAKGPPREEAPPARTTGSGPAASKGEDKAPKGEDKAPKLVCEQVEQMGSHFKRKVCATPEAWEARRRRDAALMERMGDQGAGCGGVANPC